MSLAAPLATFDSEPFAVKRADMIAYARATNDEEPAHLEGELAPPLFAVVPALKTMVRAQRAVCDDFSLHGEHDLVIHRPIRAGMTIGVRARLVGARRTAAGATFITRGELCEADGTLLNAQTLVGLVRGMALDKEWGEAAATHRFPEALAGQAPDATVVQALDPDQTRRYCEASNDRSSYTYDDDAARARGLPGAIVHGLCTMAFVARAVIAHACKGEPQRLRRIAVRFAGLWRAAPGERLATGLWQAGDGRIACEATDREGHIVIRHGWAEIMT